MTRSPLLSGRQFPDAWRVGDLIFISGQVALAEDGSVVGSGDIAVQTRVTWENLRRILRRFGCDTNDLVKVNTYVVFNGSDTAFASFWARMDEARREFIASPGPAATAVRVPGLALPGLLIEIDGIAAIGTKGDDDSQRARMDPGTVSN